MASSALPVVLFALCGVLVGGAVSMRRQGAGWFAVALLGVLAVLAAGAGTLYLLP